MRFQSNNQDRGAVSPPIVIKFKLLGFEPDIEAKLQKVMHFWKTLFLISVTLTQIELQQADLTSEIEDPSRLTPELEDEDTRTFGPGSHLES